MGLRCLLGHDFDDPELRREREEQGEEVVITVSEEKTCSRCGYTKTVSENKEVTSIEQLAETAGAGEPAATETATAGATASTDTAEGATAAGGAEPTAASGSAESPTPAGEAATAAGNTESTSPDQPAETGAPGAEATPRDDAELVGEDADTATEPTAPEPTDATAEPADSGDDVDAADDDGIILSEADDEKTPDETPEREPGEWPDHETDEPTGDHEWPEQSGDDEGYNATTPADEQPEEVTFGGGFTPEVDTNKVDADAADDDAVIEEPAGETLTKAGEASVYEPTIDDINTEFYCPECGLSRHAGTSSMRAGDICPECRRGYIAEREL